MTDALMTDTDQKEALSIVYSRRSGGTGRLCNSQL